MLWQRLGLFVSWYFLIHLIGASGVSVKCKTAVPGLKTRLCTDRSPPMAAIGPFSPCSPGIPRTGRRGFGWPCNPGGREFAGHDRPVLGGGQCVGHEPSRVGLHHASRGHIIRREKLTQSLVLLPRGCRGKGNLQFLHRGAAGIGIDHPEGLLFDQGIPVGQPGDSQGRRVGATDSGRPGRSRERPRRSFRRSAFRSWRPWVRVPGGTRKDTARSRPSAARIHIVCPGNPWIDSSRPAAAVSGGWAGSARTPNA